MFYFTRNHGLRVYWTVQRIHRESKKQATIVFLSYIASNVDRFSQFFTPAQSAANLIPPHLWRVATLPCERIYIVRKNNMPCSACDGEALLKGELAMQISLYRRTRAILYKNLRVIWNLYKQLPLLYQFLAFCVKTWTIFIVNLRKINSKLFPLKKDNQILLKCVIIK